MSSEFLRIIDEAPTKTLLLIAAILVIACQLVAMVMVAGGQVEKAQLREAIQASAIAATAGCIESNLRVALKDCSRSGTSLTAQSGTDLGILNPQSFNLVKLGSAH